MFEDVNIDYKIVFGSRVKKLIVLFNSGNKIGDYGLRGLSDGLKMLTSINTLTLLL